MAECAGNRRDVLSEIQLSVDEVLKSFLHGYNLFQGFSAPASLRGEQVVARTAVGKDSEPVELPDPREVASQIMEQLKKLRSLVAAIPVDDDTLEARHESLETLVEKVAALREELRHAAGEAQASLEAAQKATRVLAVGNALLGQAADSLAQHQGTADSA